MNLAYAFARIGLRYGQRPAIVAEDGRTIPYADFARRVQKVGSGLTQLGLGDGTRVALCIPDSPEELEVDYGILASPYMRVQLDPRGRVEDVAACARDAEPEAIIFHASVASLVDEATKGLDLRRIVVGGSAHEALGYEDWLRRDGDAPIPDRDEAGLKSIQYSSGTTSKPKGIVLTERNLLTLLGNLLSDRPVLPGDVFLHVRTLHLGSATVIIEQLLGGGKVVLGGRFKPETFPDLVARHKATSSSLVPTHLVRQLDASFDPAAFRTMRVITLGGAPAAPDTFEAALERIG
ncbi:MAG TPA: AMP-binding protein, partial [Chloroflexota bacterium]|nr:AMP-binding protein [Chloroflexota bacterium]